MNQTHIITFVRVTTCLDIYSSVYWYTLLNNLLVISPLTQPYANTYKGFLYNSADIYIDKRSGPKSDIDI